MRRFILALVPALLLMATAVPAMASTQPDNGSASDPVRNERSAFGGPHCHINTVASDAQPVFDSISAYPSHKAHIETGLPDTIFAAAPC
jgi:hypothetical protein